MVNLFPMHRHILRRLDPNSNLIASDVQDSHLDVVAYLQGFARGLLLR